MKQGAYGQGRDGYHHGNLREALIQSALLLIAERGLAGFAIAELARAVGVSSSAPYRHFRDRDAVLAEVARRGFEGLALDLEQARLANLDPVMGLQQCAQAHLAFAGREAAVYATMFEAGLQEENHPELANARRAAFNVLRQGAQSACERSKATHPPPAMMVALHVWSLTHGIAALFVRRNGQESGRLPCTPSELLEAGLLVYFGSLDMPLSR